eukprot:ANDGO_03245.mRNA.1 hypothetical protein
MRESRGVLIKCMDEAICMFLKNLNVHVRRFIICEFDSLHLLVAEKDVDFIQEKIDELMDEIAYERIDASRTIDAKR